MTQITRIEQRKVESCK